MISTGNRLRLLAVLFVLVPLIATAETPRLLFEFGVGPTIPLTSYLDSNVEDGFATVDNNPHAAIQLSLIIKGFTVRYAANIVALGESRYEWPTSSLNRINPVLQEFGEPPLQKSGSEQVNDTITFHSLSIGYRGYLTDSRWQPYIPIEIGAVIVSGDPLEEKSLYGASASTGIGLDVQVFKAFYMGLAVRYTFVITEQIPDAALVGFSSNNPSFDSAAAIGHLLSITLQTQVRF